MNTITVEMPMNEYCFFEVWFDDDGTINRVWKTDTRNDRTDELTEKQWHSNSSLYNFLNREVYNSLNSRVSGEQSLFDEYY